ncbi:MAG: hypothetical protein QOD60_209 [Solirubrobacterales bacterium]|jgi:hypothetical protein|nr:hypothetical protein [Solirubrobacterales bacterium]
MGPLPKLAALGAAAFVALVSGCGGGGGGTQVSGPELITKGDELCRAEQQNFKQIQATPPANASAAADQTGQLVASAQKELDALRNLKPPGDLSSKYEAYLEAQQRALDLLEQGQKAAEQQDGNTYGKLQKQISDGAQKRHELARAVGFKNCSNPVAGSSAPG